MFFVRLPNHIALVAFRLHTPSENNFIMNLFALGVETHNQRVAQRSRREALSDGLALYFIIIESAEDHGELGPWMSWQRVKQLYFELREARWKASRAAEKREGRKKRQGSWRQRRGNGFGWVVVR